MIEEDAARAGIEVSRAILRVVQAHSKISASRHVFSETREEECVQEIIRVCGVIWTFVIARRERQRVNCNAPIVKSMIVWSAGSKSVRRFKICLFSSVRDVWVDFFHEDARRFIVQSTPDNEMIERNKAHVDFEASVTDLGACETFFSSTTKLQNNVGLSTCRYNHGVIVAERRPWTHLTEDTPTVYITATALESARGPGEFFKNAITQASKEILCEKCVKT